VAKTDSTSYAVPANELKKTGIAEKTRVQIAKEIKPARKPTIGASVSNKHLVAVKTYRSVLTK